MRIRVYPYRQGSRSARALADALGGRVLKLENSRYRYRDGDLIINWGASECPFRQALNRSESVARAGNKLLAFRALQEAGVRIPRFAETLEGVQWAGDTVVRHKLRGHSGDGIELVAAGRPLPRAPLYVEYIKKQDEFRIHVVRGEVIAMQRKARARACPNPNWQIRNVANGFNFARQGVNPPDDVLAQSIRSVAALGLDFGAVDAVFNTRSQQAFILEVNTAPGLEGTTINDYSNSLRNLPDLGD